MSAFGTELRRLRSRNGLSLRALAARTHYSHGYLWDLEQGRKTPPHDTAAVLDQALNGSGALIAAASGIQPVPDWADDRLRTVVAGSHHPDPATVDHLAQALAVQRRLEDTVGAGHVLLPVLGQTATVAQIRAATVGPLHDKLLRLESAFAQFAGWLHQDLGRRSESEQWYARALAQSLEAGDSGMTASILSMQSNAAWGAGNVRRAVALAEASARQATTPGVLALSEQQLARGLAAAGQRDDALRALDRAEAHSVAAMNNRDREPAWIYFSDPARLRIQRALALRELGDYREAADLFEQSLAGLPDGFTRDRGQYLARLAVTHALSGEREGALLIAGQARALGVSTGSERTLLEVRRAEQLAGSREPDRGS
ncbi:helix-turn-helix domain-containing protein [Polymorphospora rubra]|uniref:HTH cro/C1-type domain-containing protein n=1 Tax=Polymorphospora rubra TaxID=338584 RepID=A0A810MZV5_9ACTN|nr:helix-turn-helix transcriptional regulator [Polymorphospora rubra]BCJ65083.1 hypothetical protein Prubr_21040 [Polymorphospora rubra]